MASPLSPVVRLLRTPAAFDDAVALFRAASLEQCLSALHGNATLPASILRARTLMRLERLRDAAAELARAAQRAQDDATAMQRGEIAMLLAATQFRSGDATASEEHLAAARAYVWSTRDADLHSELDRHTATMRWAQGRLDDAERHARRALSGRSPLHKALALEMVGAIEGGRRHFQTQVACAEEALDVLAQGTCPDVWVEGALLRTLAVLAHQLGLGAVAERVEARALGLAWTPELAQQHYETLRNLAWCAVVAGDHLKAFRLFRESARYAPSTAWQLFSFLDRSYLAREMGERIFAAAELDEAERLASQVRWDATTGGERCALLLLAELVAANDPARAESILARYRAIKPGMSVLVSQRDGMLRALEAHAFGVVSAAAGQTARAGELLHESFDIWRSSGFVWRATRTAVELADMLGDRRHLDFARDRIAGFPNAWFARSRYFEPAAKSDQPLHVLRA